MASALGTWRPPGRRKASSGRPRGRGGRHRWGIARDIEGRAGNPGPGGKSRGGREIEGAGAKSSGKTTQSLQNRERIEREREEREGLREADELAAPRRILGDGDPCAAAHLRLSARLLPHAALPPLRHICWSAAPAPLRRRAARAPLHLFCWSTAAGPRPCAALRKTAMVR